MAVPLQRRPAEPLLVVSMARRHVINYYVIPVVEPTKCRSHPGTRGGTISAASVVWPTRSGGKRHCAHISEALARDNMDQDGLGCHQEYPLAGRPHYGGPFGLVLWVAANADSKSTFVGFSRSAWFAVSGSLFAAALFLLAVQSVIDAITRAESESERSTTCYSAHGLREVY